MNCIVCGNPACSIRCHQPKQPHCQQQILDLLGSGELTAQQLADLNNRGIHATLDSLRQLHKKKLVFQPRKLFWKCGAP